MFPQNEQKFQRLDLRDLRKLGNSVRFWIYIFNYECIRRNSYSIYGENKTILSGIYELKDGQRKPKLFVQLNDEVYHITFEDNTSYWIMVMVQSWPCIGTGIIFEELDNKTIAPNPVNFGN